MPTRLAIVTPESPIVEVDVEGVVIPGEQGDFGVLPEHEPFLAPLRPGVLEFMSEGTRQRVVISGGFAEVSQDHATILARTAEPAAEIDRARAERARDEAARILLERGTNCPPDEAEVLRHELARAEARLQGASS